MTRGILEATAAAGAKLVFADNLYMYGPVDGPMTEETPPVAQTKKGMVRAAMADGTARRRIATAGCAWSSAARPTTSAPADSSSAVGERFFKAVLAGKKTQWFADLDQPHTLSYLPDMARAFVVLGDRAGGRRSGVAHARGAGADGPPVHRAGGAPAGYRARGRPCWSTGTVRTARPVRARRYASSRSSLYQYDTAVRERRGQVRGGVRAVRRDVARGGAARDAATGIAAASDASGDSREPGHLPAQSRPARVGFVVREPVSRPAHRRRAFLPLRPQTL